MARGRRTSWRVPSACLMLGVSRRPHKRIPSGTGSRRLGGEKWARSKTARKGYRVGRDTVVRIRIRREIDIEWLREIYALALPAASWCHDDDKFWIATRGPDLLAFASARPRGDMLELTSCGVVSSAAGTGMQRRMLRVRERYARRLGLPLVGTYAARDNYASITNLIRAGYRFAPCQPRADYFNFVKAF